jgi:hypothetical protein
MFQDELIDNISSIRKYYEIDSLDDKQREERKKLTLQIIKNIKDILYILYFDGYLLGATESWGYKSNTLTINFKKINYHVFFTVEIDVFKNKVQTSLRVQNNYQYFQDANLKITDKSLRNSGFKISKFNWDNLILEKKEMKLNSINFENYFIQNTENCLKDVNEKNSLYKNFYENLDKKDLFLFDAEGKVNVTWKELNNYQASSENINETNKNLLSYFFESESNLRDEIMLVLLHLNLSIGYRFLNVIRQSDTSDGEKIIMYEQMIYRSIKTIQNHTIDGGAALSTRLYTNMLAGMMRGKQRVIQRRVSTHYVGVGKIAEIEREYKKETDEYPSFKKLEKLVNKHALELKNLKDKSNLKKKLLAESKSALGHLAKALNTNINFDKNIGPDEGLTLLSNRSRNALKKFYPGITSIGEINLEDLPKIPALGESSTEEVVNIYTLVNTDVESFSKKISEIVNCSLNNREKIIIEKRYLQNLESEILIESRTTLEEISNEFGVTRERIRQIEQFALEKITIVYEKFKYKTINVSWAKSFIKDYPTASSSSKIQSKFIKNKMYFIGQLIDSEFFKLNINEVINKLEIKVSNQHLINYLIENFENEIIEVNLLSYRSGTALKKFYPGITSLGEINLEDLQKIPALGKSSITEITELYYLLNQIVPDEGLTLLSNRSRNALKKFYPGITSIGEINLEDLQKIPALGEKSIDEIFKIYSTHQSS